MHHRAALLTLYYRVGDPLGQRLSVTVVKGTGLPAMDSNGKSDVYATLEVRFNTAAVCRRRRPAGTSANNTPTLGCVVLHPLPW